MQLTDGEKLILIMLSEIHEKLAIPNGIDPKFVRDAIYSGNAWGLKWKYAGIFDSAESPDDVRHDVVNILDMWSFMESSYKDLSNADKTRIENEAHPFGDARFSGFDGNNESEYISVARFLIDHLDRFTDFKGRDLNSHMPSIDRYSRMFLVFEPIHKSLGLSGKKLGATEIIEILKAGRNS